MTIVVGVAIKTMPQIVLKSTTHRATFSAQRFFFLQCPQTNWVFLLSPLCIVVTITAAASGSNLFLKVFKTFMQPRQKWLDARGHCSFQYFRWRREVCNATCHRRLEVLPRRRRRCCCFLAAATAAAVSSKPRCFSALLGFIHLTAMRTPILGTRLVAEVLLTPSYLLEALETTISDWTLTFGSYM